MSAPEPRPRPVSGRSIAVIAVGILLLTVTTVVLLWWPATSGLTDEKLVTARFEAVRIGLSIGIGGGGVFALYLSWRRQRTTEQDLDNRERALAHQRDVAADAKAHQDRMAAITEKDGVERRITDLYTKAADQLGSDKAPVRMAGLYALERLAQDNPGHRQTVVNVYCAYLRMPYDPPLGSLPEGGDLLDHRQRLEEREVRRAVQRILLLHLRPQTPESFWPDMDLGLTGAVLIDFDLDRCRIRSSTFALATFKHRTNFTGTEFGSYAWFRSATFTDDVRFDGARFGGLANFTEVTFQRSATFAGAEFHDESRWRDTRFERGRPDELAWVDALGDPDDGVAEVTTA
ncbi:pentapeptide repeat-containing protein [Actinokineospora terrae]|uniref:pentapeptide repeat-containing protein n=1 Tax=Actinokineospora terrae TaxID=155974 RepID=UPI0011605A13|nr:pentapeptide repeat-containing protein [Actinokineospora terrae]